MTSKVQQMLTRLAFAHFNVSVPVILYLGIDKPSGESDLLGNPEANAAGLLTATGLFESGFLTSFQSDGPALGWFQMEPATHDDLIVHELRSRARVDGKIRALVPPVLRATPSTALATSQHYGAAMARVKYLHAKAPIPPWTDPQAVACYWKDYYNTVSGGGVAVKEADLWADVCKSIASGDVEGW